MSGAEETPKSLGVVGLVGSLVAVLGAVVSIVVLNGRQLMLLISVVATIAAISCIVFLFRVSGWRRKVLLTSGLTVSLVALAVSIFMPISNEPQSHCRKFWNTWSTSPHASGPDVSPSQVTNVRTGFQECYDSIVLDMSGPASGYDVKYVSTIRTAPDGPVIPLEGNAILRITVKAAVSSGSQEAQEYKLAPGQPLPGVNLAGYPVLRDAKFVGTSEGMTTIAVGVRTRLPFHVLKLDDRVVVDIAPRW